MLTNQPVIYRKRKGREKTKVVTSPPAFALIAATFDSVEPSVTLTFSWPIDIGGLDAGSFFVLDGTGSQSYAGWSATLVSSASVKIGLESQGAYTGEGIILNVGEDNGVRGADEGPVWNGVSDLELPYP